MKDYTEAIKYFNKRLTIAKEDGGVGKRTKQRRMFEQALEVLTVINKISELNETDASLKFAKDICSKVTLGSDSRCLRTAVLGFDMGYKSKRSCRKIH